MRDLKLLLTVLAMLVSVSSWAADEYKVVYEQNDLYHIYLDVAANLDLLTAIKGETVFKRITREVCGTSDCTTRFWLSKTFAAKTADMTDESRKAIVAEYQQRGDQQTMISHFDIERRKAEFAEATCVKEVFNAYCLGGSSSDLPPHENQQRAGEIDRRYYGADTAVFSVRGKVAEVVRIYPDMSWLKFRSTEYKLSDLYGSGDDLSYFPDYADDDSSRATAIRLGRGQVVKTWKQEGWTVRWAWVEDHGRLSYMHNALIDVLEAEDPGEGL